MQGRINTKSNFNDKEGVSAEGNVCRSDKGAFTIEKVFLNGPSTELKASCSEKGAFTIEKVFLNGPSTELKASRTRQGFTIAALLQQEKVHNPGESGPTEQSDCGLTRSGSTPRQKAEHKAALDLGIATKAHFNEVKKAKVLDKAGPSNLSCSSRDGVLTAYPLRDTGVQPNESSTSTTRPLYPILSENLAGQRNVGVGRSKQFQESVVSCSRSEGQLPQTYDCKTSSFQKRNTTPWCVKKWIQTAQKLFRCVICGKAFLTDDHFQLHIRVHISQNPNQCAYCAQMFRSKDNCEKHMRTFHSGYELIKCIYCEFWFSQKDTLDTHVEFVHPEVKLFKKFHSG